MDTINQKIQKRNSFFDLNFTDIGRGRVEVEVEAQFILNKKRTQVISRRLLFSLVLIMSGIIAFTLNIPGGMEFIKTAFRIP